MKLSIGDIVIDDNLNVRDELDKDTIERYAECFDQLPPVVVFDIDDGYLLADGFHRVEAAKRLGRTDIDADVREGTRKDTEEYAALANLKHGKPLTRAERKEAVVRLLKLRPERANQWIAQDMGCSVNSVIKYREELEAGFQIATLEKLIGKDGKEYPRNIEQPKKDEAESPVEEHQPQLEVEDDTTEELKAEVSEDDDNETQTDIQESEVVETKTPEPTTQPEGRIASRRPQMAQEAMKMSNDGTASRRPAKLPADAPEGWDTFAEYHRWIGDYAFDLLKENIHYARRVHRSLELLVTRLEEVLEELDELS